MERNWKKSTIPDNEKWQRGRNCDMSRSMNIEKTDQLVWEAVLHTASNSSYLKEQVKQRLLGTKAATDDVTEPKLKNEESKRRKLFQSLKRLSDTEAQTEFDYRTGELPEAVYTGIKQRMVQKREQLESQVEQSRLREKSLRNTKQWVNWLQNYTDDVEALNSKTDEEKKEYIRTLVEKIIVSLPHEAGNKHRVIIKFKRPIVADSIEYLDRRKKSEGYKVIGGEKELFLEDIDLRGKAGRPKKKD
jgi:hypothetical protein